MKVRKQNFTQQVLTKADTQFKGSKCGFRCSKAKCWAWDGEASPSTGPGPEARVESSSDPSCLQLPRAHVHRFHRPRWPRGIHRAFSPENNIPNHKVEVGLPGNSSKEAGPPWGVCSLPHYPPTRDCSILSHHCIYLPSPRLVVSSSLLITAAPSLLDSFLQDFHSTPGWSGAFGIQWGTLQLGNHGVDSGKVTVLGQKPEEQTRAKAREQLVLPSKFYWLSSASVFRRPFKCYTKQILAWTVLNEILYLATERTLARVPATNPLLVPVSPSNLPILNRLPHL